MKDITLLYYTANVVEEPFGDNVRKHLLSLFPEGIPLISVSHKPLDFGQNICVSGIEVSAYSIYKQILLGCREIKTKYVACCEDDSLYNREHFDTRSTRNAFTYNNNRWHVNRETFFHRNRLGMLTCIAPVELMIRTLELRFEKYPIPIVMPKWGEPGRHEKMIGLPVVNMDIANTKIPVLTFNHRTSIGGRRRFLPHDTFKTELSYWGKSQDIWDKMYGVSSGN